MDTQQQIKKFFRGKAKQLLALAEQVATEHPGLTGSHRENIINNYLKEILPKRLGIGKGMVYGIMDRSREIDILIWDEQHYPALNFSGHSFFFAESAKALVEIKTRWSTDEFKDIQTKSAASKGIFKQYKSNVKQELYLLQEEIVAIKQGTSFSGLISIPHHIASAALIFWGGQDFTIKSLPEDELLRIDSFYPDLMLFLDAGKVLVKEYYRDEDDTTKGNAFLRLYEAGDDALLVFTVLLMGEVMQRTVLTEYPFYFEDYFPPSIVSNMKFEETEFKMGRPLPGGIRSI